MKYEFYKYTVFGMIKKIGWCKYDEQEIFYYTKDRCKRIR